MRQLFELCGEDRDIRFSPFVWRARLALVHKGLEFEGVPTRFLEKDGYADSGSKAVPVLRDGDKWIVDSLDIAKYLDETYPENPLFPGGTGEARFILTWMDQTLVRGVFPLVVADICACLDAENAAYFRETREKALGAKLEDIQSGRDGAVEGFRASLQPMRSTLEVQDFLSGDAPGYADIVAFGTFMWARTVSDFALLSDDDPIYAWRERMLDAYNGYGRAVKCAG